MVVSVDYLPSSRRAAISASEDNPNWIALRRLFLDTSVDSVVESDLKITIPWWAFLSTREALKHILQRSSARLSATDDAMKQLHLARAREREYETQSTLDFKLESRLNAAGFSRPLSAAQLNNVARLVTRNAGATFSVPGAGKTTEALAYFALKATSSDRLVVIAPKNAFAAWEEQLRLCLPRTGFAFVRLRGGVAAIAEALSAGPKFSLITYQQFVVDGVRESVSDFIASSPTFVFLDESHRIKSGVGFATADAVLAAAHLPVAKLIMSGTPMPNSTADLVPQFNFLYPEISVRPDTVVHAVQPIFVRTTKADLGLPPVQRSERKISMTSGQRELYDLVRSEAARQAQRFLGSSDRAQLRRLGRSAMKMLQVASNPALLAKDVELSADLLRNALADGDSNKITYATQRARSLARNDQKVVIWTTFVDNVELIAHRLADLGAHFIHGRVDAGNDDEEDTREYKIREFLENPSCFVLVANPAAAGEGISLHTKCHHAIYVDRNFNAAQYLQSEDRIHRFGVEVPTYVEVLVAADSIDSVVTRRLEAKVARMGQVLNDPGLSIEAFPPDLDDDTFDSDDALDLARTLVH